VYQSKERKDIIEGKGRCSRIFEENSLLLEVIERAREKKSKNRERYGKRAGGQKRHWGKRGIPDREKRGDSDSEGNL